MYGEQCVQAPAQGLELAPKLFVLPPLLWPRQRPGAAESLLLHQPRTEPARAGQGTLEGHVWPSTGEGLTGMSLLQLTVWTAL